MFGLQLLFCSSSLSWMRRGAHLSTPMGHATPCRHLHPRSAPDALPLRRACTAARPTTISRSFCVPHRALTFPHSRELANVPVMTLKRSFRPSVRFGSSSSTSAAEETKLKETISNEEATNMWWLAVSRGNCDEMLDVIDTVGVDAIKLHTKQTALHMAAQKTNADANIDAVDAEGWTPIDLAVRSGNKEYASRGNVARLLLGWQMVLQGDEVVGKLLRKSYHVNPASVQKNLLMNALPSTPEATQTEFASATRRGDLFLVHLIWFFSPHRVSLDDGAATPQPLLFLALQSGNAKILRFLLDMGADATVRSTEGLTLLDAAIDLASEWALHVFHKSGVDEGIDTALLRACASNHASASSMVRFLLKMGAKVGSTGTDGATGLHLAAMRGDEACVVSLLEHGAPVDAKTKQGLTALFYAFLEGHTAVVRALLERNANASIANSSNCTPLFVAAHEGHLRVVELLLAHKVDLNHLGDLNQSQEGGAPLLASPLFTACMNGHADVARLLLEAGADINGRGATGLKDAVLPPLVGAMSHPSVLLLLLSRGATPNVLFPASLVGSEQRELLTTPLAWAARTGDLGLATLLLQHGADASLAESSGQTPLQLAQHANYSDVIALLKRNLAKTSS